MHHGLLNRILPCTVSPLGLSRKSSALGSHCRGPLCLLWPLEHLGDPGGKEWGSETPEPASVSPSLTFVLLGMDCVLSAHSPRLREPAGCWLAWGCSVCGHETSWYRMELGWKRWEGWVPCQALLPPAHADPDLRSLGILNLNLAFLYRWEVYFSR